MERNDRGKKIGKSHRNEEGRVNKKNVRGDNKGESADARKEEEG